jgi:hypothetical protein
MNFVFLKYQLLKIILADGIFRSLVFEPFYFSFAFLNFLSYYLTFIYFISNLKRTLLVVSPNFLLTLLFSPQPVELAL